MKNCWRCFKKFITSVVLFILMLLFASKAESRGVTETSKLGVTSKSAPILGFLYSFCLMFQKTRTFDQFLLIMWIKGRRKFCVLFFLFQNFFLPLNGEKTFEWVRVKNIEFIFQVKLLFSCVKKKRYFPFEIDLFHCSDSNGLIQRTKF